MGWSGTKAFMWGDEPQDEVDGALSAYYAGIKFNAYTNYPEAARRVALATLKSDESLRERVDGTYSRVWGRKANDKEFENLLTVGLGLPGGRTVYWGPTKKVKKQVASKGRKKSSPRASVCGIK